MIIQVYIDEHTHRTLFRIAEKTGRTVENLAEAAVSEAALKTPEWREVIPNPAEWIPKTKRPWNAAALKAALNGEV